jgi:hypothetical protein
MNHANKKSYLQKLLDEYNPPFPLGYKWESKEKVKIKLPNPYVPGDKETVEFPVLSDETKMADRALFYQQVLDLETQSEITSDNVPYLYHIFRRCLKGQALIDWNTFAGIRPMEERTLENYSADIDCFIKFHESRANEDLLRAQKSYMNRLNKPRNTSPSEFRNQLLALNNLLTTIPNTADAQKYSDLDLKYLFVEAMPYKWRNKFQEIGKKARIEPFDELSSFFDFYHSSDTNTLNSTEEKGWTGHHMKQQVNKVHLNDDDPCPLHGGRHKWIDCYDNKRGPKFRPITRPSQHNDQYFSESFNASSQGPPGNNDTTDHNPYDDDDEY